MLKGKIGSRSGSLLRVEVEEVWIVEVVEQV